VLSPLPIQHVLPEIEQALATSHAVVLRAPTGAGKTTRVPPALLQQPWVKGNKILVLQPRRVAARATAVRMAQEHGSKIGEIFGYATRFDSQVTKQTQVICLTEGLLLRRLTTDPFLDHVAAVVFDEFHERNLASDLALGMLRQVQLSVRPELKLVVMSATLDPVPIANYLGNCPTVESLGRSFPVAIEYSRDMQMRHAAEIAAQGVRELLPRTTGHLLVFLPGVGEIRKTGQFLESYAVENNCKLCELFGEMTPAAQDAILAASSQRKIILATNIAETSLTIEGVTGVVDTRCSTYAGLRFAFRFESLGVTACLEGIGRTTYWSRRANSTRHLFKNVARSNAADTSRTRATRSATCRFDRCRFAISQLDRT
jgi:ATP-dependent helicase HrpB